MANLIFYVMAGLAVVAALGVVVARNPMLSVLALLGSFFALATIYLVAGFQTLAALQILVYAGAILVLFLFVIMLLNLKDSELGDEYPLGMRLGVAGMCEEACPCDAIELTQTYTQVATTRAEKIYDKERLLRN